MFIRDRSQRGGSVVTYVRYGDKVYSPVIETGEADVVLAFEQLEAARFLPYLKVGGTVVTSTQKIDPMPVVTGDKAYPQGILEEMEGKGVNVLAVDAMSLAEEAGSQKAVNVVLIGAMARRLGGDKELWLSAVERCVPPKFLEMNKKAFELGWNASAFRSMLRGIRENPPQRKDRRPMPNYFEPEIECASRRRCAKSSPSGW